MKNRFMKRLIGYSHYVDKLVYVTVDGGRREIMKLKPGKRSFIIPSNITRLYKRCLKDDNNI